MSWFAAFHGTEAEPAAISGHWSLPSLQQPTSPDTFFIAATVFHRDSQEIASPLMAFSMRPGVQTVCKKHDWKDQPNTKKNAYADITADIPGPSK